VNGHDGATRLRHDKRSETQGRGTGWALRILKTAAGEVLVNTQKNEVLDDHT
jgi:hypothetical protein